MPELSGWHQRVRDLIVEQDPSELMINDLFIEGQGLPRSNRLTHAANFDHVFKHAQAVSRQIFYRFVLPQ